MRLKNVGIILFALSLCFFLSGCGTDKKEHVESGDSTTKATIVDDSFDKGGTGTLKCVTEAIAAEGVDVKLNYIINYKRGNILQLKSVSKISSADNSVLEGYEQSYDNIRKNYYELKYYDTRLIRDSNSVTYEVIINYEKIDTDALLAIEGAEDNVIVDGKAKLSLWLDLAGKFGTTCEEV